MGRRDATRERILDIAESAVLQKGFGATSIDELIAEADISKSGFFYHFKDKNALARALLQRYLDRDDAILDDVFRRGRELAEDPLHGFLVGLKLLAEVMAELPEGHPGCLVATYCYHERLFDRGVQEMNARAVLAWRTRFRGIFEEINALHAPRDPVDVDALADMVSVVVEGGIILSKALRNPQILSHQVLLLRSYVKLLYGAEPSPRRNGRWPRTVG